MNSTKILKAHCKNTGQYYVIEAEKTGAVFFATKFYPISLERAKEIKSEISPLALQTNDNLPKCEVCGSRKVGHGHDNNHACECEHKPENKQCIYCGSLEYDKIGDTNVLSTKTTESYNVFFVMDASGSMYAHLHEAANATRSLIKNLNTQKNTYNFIPFGSTFKYLIKDEVNIDKVSKLLNVYERYASNVGAGTNGMVMKYISKDVIDSKKPVRIIIVTDGDWSSAAEALKTKNHILAKNKNVEILAIGISGANTSFLKQMGTVQEFSKIVDTKNLEQTFIDISKMLKVG